MEPPQHDGAAEPSAESASIPADQARTQAALHAFAREPGRSVAVRVAIGEAAWEAHVAGDTPRPAASLLKLPVAIAVEQVIRADPGAGLAQGAAAGNGLGQATVHVGALLEGWSEPSVLRALDPHRTMTAPELLRLMVSSSDGPSTRWLLDAVGIEEVVAAITACGCTATEARLQPGAAGGALVGSTSANDALRLLAVALDVTRHPITAAALANSTLNSRIPLGVRRSDIAVAHKTGTLYGVAHDVAMLQVPGGEVWLAFLTDTQHDTLVGGYEMGICTQEVLAAFGIGVTGTRSAAG